MNVVHSKTVDPTWPLPDAFDRVHLSQPAELLQGLKTAQALHDELKALQPKLTACLKWVTGASAACHKLGDFLETGVLAIERIVLAERMLGERPAHFGADRADHAAYVPLERFFAGSLKRWQRVAWDIDHGITRINDQRGYWPYLTTSDVAFETQLFGTLQADHMFGKWAYWYGFASSKLVENFELWHWRHDYDSALAKVRSAVRRPKDVAV
jgi:hypothetical protein